MFNIPKIYISFLGEISFDSHKEFDTACYPDNGETIFKNDSLIYIESGKDLYIISYDEYNNVYTDIYTNWGRLTLAAIPEQLI